MQSLEAFNFLNEVEAEVEPFELHERFETLNTSDDVVVELELDQRLDAEQVVDFDDVYLRHEENPS